MTKEEKILMVQEIINKQLGYAKKIKSIVKLATPKRLSTAIKRASKSIDYAIMIKMLEMQKNVIIATPINPKFKSGGTEIVCEHSKEEIILNPKK